MAEVGTHTVHPPLAGGIVLGSHGPEYELPNPNSATPNVNTHGINERVFKSWQLRSMGLTRR